MRDIVIQGFRDGHLPCHLLLHPAGSEEHEDLVRCVAEQVRVAILGSALGALKRELLKYCMSDAAGALEEAVTSCARRSSIS